MWTKEQRRKMRDKELFGGNKAAVLKRDNYKCRQCGMTNKEHKRKWGSELTVHHIDGKGRYSKTKNHSIGNLETLCSPCHGRIDGKKGVGISHFITEEMRKKWRKPNRCGGCVFLHTEGSGKVAVCKKMFVGVGAWYFACRNWLMSVESSRTEGKGDK